MTETNRKQLLILATTYPRWQGDHEPGFVHELAKRLTHCFDVVAVVPHAPGAQCRENMDGVTVLRYRYAPERWETLVQEGGITTHLRRRPWKWLLVPVFFAAQWLTAWRVASRDGIVHAHWIILPGLVARLLRRPFLLTSHGADLFALRGRLALWLKRWVLRGAADITVVSKAMAPLVVSLHGGAKPIIAPMGVNLADRFTPDPTVSREPEHLLFVGRLVEKKGVDLLLAALPAVLKLVPQAHLSIVGHGPLEDSLKAQAVRLGVSAHVTFTGPVAAAELPCWYRRAALFIAPFREAESGDQEGFGLVLVEALGCGCPVVTSDIPAVSDVVALSRGASQVPAENVTALAEAISERLLHPDRLVPSQEEIEKLEERFGWGVVAARYVTLLERLSAARRPS